MNKLKVVILFSMLLITILVVCSCKSNWVDDDEAAEQLAYQIFECLNNKDAEGLKALFSKEVSDSHDLDKEIEILFEAFEGKIVSYDSFNSGSGREAADYGKQTLLVISPVIRNVKTDAEKIYKIRFFAYVICEEDEDKVGIGGLKIVVDEETEYVVGDW